MVDHQIDARVPITASVLRLGFFQDGDVGVGVFSKREPHPDFSEGWAKSGQPMYPERKEAKIEVSWVPDHLPLRSAV